MLKMIKSLRRDQKGATAIEYGLIAALVAVAAVGAMTTLGDSVTSTFTDASNKMTGTTAEAPAEGQ